MKNKSYSLDNNVTLAQRRRMVGLVAVGMSMQANIACMGQRVHSECAQHWVMDGWVTLAKRPHMVGLQYMVGILTSRQHWVNICILIVREVW